MRKNSNLKISPSVVMVFGTFDIFHRGHRHFLREAKKRGDNLIVVIARDVTVEKVKRKRPLYTEKERRQAVQESGLAEKVILGNRKDKYAVIRKYRPQVIALGYDQKFFVDKLQDKLKEFNLNNTQVVRLTAYYPQKYKSSLLRKGNEKKIL